MASKTDTLVIQSKVKAIIKKNKMMCSSDVMNALSSSVEKFVMDGCKRAKSNGRKTVRAADL